MSKWLKSLLAGAATALTGFVAIMLAKFLYVSFNGASDDIKVGSLAALASVVTFVGGSIIEQSRELRQRINSEKIPIYQRYFDMYFGLFSHQKLHGTPIDEKKLLADLLNFQKEVILWGSDEVLVRFHEFRAEMNKMGNAGSPPDPAKLASLMRASGNLFVAMRRDIGYSRTSVDARMLASLQLADDAETRKILAGV